MAFFSPRVGGSVAAALLAVLVPVVVRADVTCGHCGCIMHTDHAPPECWKCQKPLYTPAPNPNAEPVLPGDETFGPMSSGFELGVMFISAPRGIRVTRVKPDSAASGVLFVNDIVAAAAYVDDDGRTRQLPTRTSSEMENVKHLAGQSKTALMIRRPNGQVRYAFVMFRPIGGGTPVAGAVVGTARAAASSIEIDETGAAAALFSSEQGKTFEPPNSQSKGSDAGRGDNAADFFNNREP